MLEWSKILTVFSQSADFTLYVKKHELKSDPSFIQIFHPPQSPVMLTFLTFLITAILLFLHANPQVLKWGLNKKKTGPIVCLESVYIITNRDSGKDGHSIM